MAKRWVRTFDLLWIRTSRARTSLNVHRTAVIKHLTACRTESVNCFCASVEVRTKNVCRASNMSDIRPRSLPAVKTRRIADLVVAP